MPYTGQSYRLSDGSEVYYHEGPLTKEEVKEIIGSGERLNSVFAVPLSKLMEYNYEGASDYISEDTVFGECYDYELEDWTYTVVGVGEYNTLYMLVNGWIVEC